MGIWQSAIGTPVEPHEELHDATASSAPCGSRLTRTSKKRACCSLAMVPRGRARTTRIQAHHHHLAGKSYDGSRRARPSAPGQRGRPVLARGASP